MEGYSEIEIRVVCANRFIGAISVNGRKYFSYEGRTGWIERSDSGHLFYHNEWNQKRIYISRYGPYKGFHHGGTLHSVVAGLVRFIQAGERMKASFFDAKHWAYGDKAMNAVIRAGVRLGILE